jgi:DNA topoisomerase I
MAAALPSDAVVSARAAGLRYVSDQAPGIRRKRVTGGFEYIGLDGKPIESEDELRRIKSLAVPPAYEDVWICPVPNGHLQATGRDARGRKQYRYHKRWREVRDESKFDRMLAFAKALPEMRRRVDEDLARPGLPREKVLATIVRLLELTLVRVGNDEYAKTNKSYGLTTLLERHVRVDGSTVRFRFRGKSGRTHDVDVRDRRLANIVRKLVEIPGQDLFEYIDDEGQAHAVRSQDVNDYLREISGGDFSAKDFRTLAATVLCAATLADFEASKTQKEARDNVAAVVSAVAERLGNTPTVCKKAYIHPLLIDEYLSAGVLRLLRAHVKDTNLRSGLHEDELRVIRTIERLLKRYAASSSAK